MPNRVLVVDDDAMSREVLAMLLEHEGYLVECAASGDDALAHLHRGGTAPPIVLCDVQMPGTTGKELAALLRRACGPTAFLLAMSGSGATEEEISYFDGFLLKPFNVSQMAALLPETKNIVGKVRSTPATSNASKSKMNATLEEPITATAAYETGGRHIQVLDEKIFSQLTVAMPTPQLLQMYTMCLDDARERIASMRALAAAGDGVQFSRQAHAIKGGSGMLGATELYALSGALEKAGLAEFGEEAGFTVNPLDELDSACGRLERILASRALNSST